MHISVQPKHSHARVMKVLKGKSAEYLRKDYRELCQRNRECTFGCDDISFAHLASSERNKKEFQIDSRIKGLRRRSANIERRQRS